MICVTSLTDETRGVFEKLFAAYYEELGCEEDSAHLVEEYVIPDLLAGLLQAEMLYDDGTPVGFVIRQIDDIDNEWCFREGWGDIRELYIVPSLRRQGLGKFLLYTAEMKLKEAGADKAYCLPAAGTEGFFTACGYQKTDEYDDEFDCYVYEKHDLNNCECKRQS